MAGFDDPAFYGDRWAEVYDERHAGLDPAAAVEFLAGLAGGGRVLELAIGTGRVALPLASRGIAVEGVDASQAMVDRLRAKPGGPAIPVTIGDMAQVPVRGPFRLVYLVFNSLFGLLDQARQAGCFASVARVLEPGGAFAIECFVPDVARFDRGQRAETLAVTEDSATLRLSRHDAVQQRITMQIVTLDEHGMLLRPLALRYAWPSELDLMAAHAGLQLTERYADWPGSPLTRPAPSMSRSTSAPDAHQAHPQQPVVPTASTRRHYVGELRSPAPFGPHNACWQRARALWAPVHGPRYRISASAILGL